MSRPSSRLFVLLGTTACLAALALAGCGGGPSPSADATCGDFGKMSDADQKETTRLVLEQNGVSTDGLGAGLKIDAGRMTLKAYCAASGDTAKVGNVTDIGSAIEDLKDSLPDDSAK